MKFTLCHCGAESIGPDGYEEWKSCIIEVAKYPNVVCKIGGHEMFAPHDVFDIVKHCVNEFGWERCLAESNWFVQEGRGYDFIKTFDNIMTVCDKLGATQDQ